MNNVACIKWGNMYSSEYVNKLYAMVKRNLTSPFRFICFTDDKKGIYPQIETMSLPAHLKGWWGKVYYFKSPLEDITGPILTLDLDIVIVDNIDCFFEYSPNDFIMRWDYAGHGNSSVVMRFEANQYPHIYSRLHLNTMDHSIDNRNKGFKRKKYWGDQMWITEQINNDPQHRRVRLWPKEWVQKYSIECHRERVSKKVYATIPRKQRKPGEFFVPEEMKIMVFAGPTGNNKRHEHVIRQWWHANDINN